MTDDVPEADGETRGLLGAADPARSLPPIDADALHSLLEDTMSQNSTEDETTTDDLRKHRARRALFAGAAAAGVIGIVGVGIAVFSDDGGSNATATPTAGAATITELTLGKAALGKCMVPSASNVAGQDLAFEGTVLSATHDLVTLDPSTFYKGTATDLVTVNKPDLGISELPVDFEVGKTYLVGATAEGNVSICGLSGLATKELKALYAEAFPQK